MYTTILSGKEDKEQYQNLKFLAPGGMGDIYTAQDVINNHTVAIKIIRIEHLSDKELLEQEFRIATTLSHPNIIKTYYYGEFTEETGSYFYSVMEFHSAGSLRKKIGNTTAKFPIDTCLDYCYDLLRGMQEAHKYIIHRDLKPENILIDANGGLKICDFGIARYVDMLTRTKTYKGAGTFPYMSPECWVSDPNTRQMDIYSLGIIFFEILTLQRPFTGPTEKDFKDQHLFSHLPSLSSLRPDIPVALSEIIRKMTNKKTIDRYQNMGEILEAFDKLTDTSKDKTIDVQAVLLSAHNKLNTLTEQSLKEQKTKDEYQEKQRILNFSIDQLFNQFSQVADTINESIQSEKIKYNKFIIPNNPYASTFRLLFFNEALTISFFNVDISEYIRQRKQAHNAHQNQQYGFILQEIQPDYIETDNIVLIGSATLKLNHKGRNAGFNVVLLRQNQDDIYGNWYICKFSDNQIFANVPNNFHYSIGTPEFYSEYNFGRGRVMHVRSMTFSLLQSDDIVNIISLMPSV